MASRYDVAARLAEGLAAVDDMQVYVEACRMRGYQHPDLTSHGAQIRDRYAAEEGLDLHVLETDGATLRDMSAEAEEGLRQARSQISALTAAWTGEGGTVAADFVRRHCDSADVVVEALHATAAAWGVLLDDLWQVVDRRVATTLSTAERAQAQRPVWLAAAHSVLGGDMARDNAGEVVDSQVKPFVDGAIGGDWVSAMQAADDAAAAAYRTAIGAAGGTAGVRFEVPGDLGPRYPFVQNSGFIPEPQVAADSRAAAPALPAPDAYDWPVSSDNLLGSAPQSVPTSVPPSLPPLTAATPANPLDARATMPAPSSVGAWPGLGAGAVPGLGADGLPDLSAGGVPGLGAGAVPGLGAGAVPALGPAAAIPGRFAHALSGLLGGPTDDAVPGLAALAEPDSVPIATPDVAVPESDAEPETADSQGGQDKDPGDEDGVGDGPDDESSAGEDPNADATQSDGATAAADDQEPIAAQCETDCDAASSEPASPTPAAPTPTPMPAAPVTAEPPASPSPAPAGGQATPCEIAADELPQAGQ